MILSWNYSTKRYALNTVSTPIILHSWLNHHYNQIWINLHFFASKVHFLRLFGAKIQKNFNKPPPKKPQIFINRRRTIGADTVVRSAEYLFCIFPMQAQIWPLMFSTMHLSFFILHQILENPKVIHSITLQDFSCIGTQIFNQFPANIWILTSFFSRDNSYLQYLHGFEM